MSFHVNNFIMQAAMFILCGLLPNLCLAQPRNKYEAEYIACTFTLGNTDEHEGKKNMQLKLTSSQITRDRDQRSEKEAYYVFSSSDSNCFIIVSGDKRMPEVLAYSDDSNFDTNNIPPNVRYWLDCYRESFEKLDSSNNCHHDMIASERAEGVAPLLGGNTWGQNDPYNKFCPSIRGERCVTGCVATAMAQVMKYHGFPARGMGGINYRTQTNGLTLQNNFGSLSFRWEDMLDNYDEHYSSSQADAVATLMYACGTSVKMDYCTSSQGGSGAYQTNLIPAFIENFGYDGDAAFIARRYCTNEDWHRILIHELNVGHPVNYAGQSARDGGHSFVLDGYQHHESSKYPYYHVNWGWDGTCNGFYQVTDLHPTDNGQHATMEGFISSQQLTMGVMPDDGINNGLYILCTSNLYASSTQVKAGSAIQVYSASLGNFSYKTFSGTLHVVLVSKEDNTEIILGESRMQKLDYLQEQNNISLEITIPSDIQNGQYTIQLRSRHSEAETYGYVYSKTYPQLTISNSGNTEPVITRETLLGCSELEVIDTTVVCLNIYELQNLMDAPFIGDLRMILADTSGKQLSVFGDSIQPGELSMFEIQEFPKKLRGTLIGEWSDGNYRLYVGARLINTSNYVYLSHYDVSQPGMEAQELFINAQIKDGMLIVKGRSYGIIPTSLNSVYKDEACSASFFSTTGIRQEGLRHGINIIRKPDGSTVKVLTKWK